MIEKPELTLAILRQFARAEDPYSANLRIMDIHDQFPDHDQDEIDNVVRSAIDYGWLNGIYHPIPLLDGSTSVAIGILTGLTPAGMDYIRRAEKQDG